MKHATGSDQQGFTLLEIALALGIISILSFYLLDMVDFVKLHMHRLDDRERMECIGARIRSYYLGQERLPTPGENNRLPTETLSLDQGYRYDRQGRFFLYRVADRIAGFEVDGTRAAGVLISAGPDQQFDSDYLAATTFTTRGDDLILALDVTQEAIEITLHELEVLTRRVEAYDQFFAGIQNNPRTSLYGDQSRGAPPIIDPNDYNQYYVDREPDDPIPPGKFPELYPFASYYREDDGALPGPAPTWEELIYDVPDYDWPGSEIGRCVCVESCDRDDGHGDCWPRLPPPPDPPEGCDLPPEVRWPQPGAFDAYSDPPLFPDVSGLPDLEQAAVDDSYELIDEDGCVAMDPLPLGNCLATAGMTNDPACGRATLDHCDPGDELESLLSRYGLGYKYRLDPWDNPYKWGRNLESDDRRYRTFFSAGRDGEPYTDDDITLF